MDIPTAIAIGAAIIAFGLVGYALIKHKGPQAIQQAEAAVLHRLAVDAMAAWRAAVAAELADANAAQAKAQASAAILAAFDKPV